MKVSDIWDPYTDFIDITFDETAVWLDGAQGADAVLTIGDGESALNGSFRGVLRRAGPLQEVYWQPMMFELDTDPEVWRPRKALTIGAILETRAAENLSLYVERNPFFEAWLGFTESGQEQLNMRYYSSIVSIRMTQEDEGL